MSQADWPAEAANYAMKQGQNWSIARPQLPVVRLRLLMALLGGGLPGLVLAPAEAAPQARAGTNSTPARANTAMPCRMARAASAAARMPLRTMGRAVIERSQSMSSQVNEDAAIGG